MPTKFNTDTQKRIHTAFAGLECIHYSIAFWCAIVCAHSNCVRFLRCSVREWESDVKRRIKRKKKKKGCIYKDEQKRFTRIPCYPYRKQPLPGTWVFRWIRLLCVHTTVIEWNAFHREHKQRTRERETLCVWEWFDCAYYHFWTFSLRWII